ncbi:MAG: hypothetical protein U1G07_05030 [Verrucomicrobiota bacterium]
MNAVSVVLTLAVLGKLSLSAGDAETARLADEVRPRGWIAFAARSNAGDWDLFLMRPDGSERRPLTETPAWNEGAPQFSRDGKRLLYRRLKRVETIEGNRYGEQGALVLANSDGSAARVIAEEGKLPWASWSPDGRELAILELKGISFIDAETGQVRRSLPRRGFFQQLTWSPDGKWLVGVANSFGTGWSVARMLVQSGEASAVNTVDCCTPDWFPDTGAVIFSWRPPGQRANRGNGWTQLWRADAEGKSRQLVYGEDGRHIYGGHVSPDGHYAIFSGNPQEDGDPQHAGAPMGLVRLRDAPIITGASAELRAVHPDARSGPVLILPTGWEPCWTLSEAPVKAAIRTTALSSDPNLVAEAKPTAAAPQADLDQPGRSELAAELRGRGWVVFSAQTAAGDWDLFLTRPDGSERHSITRTRESNEAGARFSPDGKRLLYYRMPAREAVDNNTYGTFELILADADGRNAASFGRDFPWASWSPDGRKIACLVPGGIRIVDVGNRQVMRTVARQGIVQQLVWSPDGKAFTGTANGLGPFWNIGCLADAGGKMSAVSETERYNCTPDWCPDSRRIVYARGIIPKQDGRAELWVGNAAGTEQQFLYGEEHRHIYGGCPSPDSKYLLFTRSVEDLGAVGRSQTTMAIIRWADTPMNGDDSAALRTRFPMAKRGPRLDLGPGWEPHWTYSETAGARGASEGK